MHSVVGEHMACFHFFPSICNKDAMTSCASLVKTYVFTSLMDT